MRNDLQIVNVRSPGGTVLLRVSGRIDAQSAAALLEECHAARSAGRNLVLNLEGVTFIASSGIGVLLALVEQFDEAAGEQRKKLYRDGAARVSRID